MDEQSIKYIKSFFSVFDKATPITRERESSRHTQPSNTIGWLLVFSLIITVQEELMHSMITVIISGWCRCLYIYTHVLLLFAI